MAPGQEEQTAKQKEALEKLLVADHPAYNDTLNFVGTVYSDLEQPFIDAETIVNDQNPFVQDLLEFVLHLQTDPKQKLSKITKITKEEGTENLMLHYEKEGAKESILNIEIHKGEPIYEAIFYVPKEQIVEAERTKRREFRAKIRTEQREKTKEELAGLKSEIAPVGTLHTKVVEQLNNISAETRAQDIETLGEASIEDIRYNTQLLFEGEANIDEEHMICLKKETFRRLKAYTSSYDNEWYTLDYMSVGGFEQEMGIGLGDILLDPDIERILVVKEGEPPILAHRGTADHGDHQGRQGFIDENGEYVKTFTGDTFRILSDVNPLMENNYGRYLTEYLEKAKQEDEVRQKHKEYYKTHKGLESYDNWTGNDIEDYLAHRDYINAELNFQTQIPEPESVGEIPTKDPGTTRMVIFGDNNGSYGRSDGDKYIAQLAEELPYLQADFILGVGDHIAGGGKVSDSVYQQMVASIRKEFEKFGDTPFALAAGNHDLNHAGEKADFTEMFRTKLLEKYEFEETPDKSAYSYKIGEATFVVFNEGTTSILDSQLDFFRQKAETAQGAVYLVNHVPPIQHAYGAGLPESGQEGWDNFEEVQAIGKIVEAKGLPFYLISGHDHFGTVIGNFLNPGSMASKYFAVQARRLQTERSIAVVDMDSMGKITHVYFREVESDFKTSLPELQGALASGNRTTLGAVEKDRTTVQMTGKGGKKPPRYEGPPLKQFPNVRVSEDINVVSQLKIGLDSEQMKNAEIIEREFRAAGLSNSIIAAALVNAWEESNLRNIPSHDKKEGSFGLFQCNTRGAGKGYTREQLLDPVFNTRVILNREVLRGAGKRLRAADKRGAPVSELASIFCYDIERPAKRETSQYNRAFVAAWMFGLEKT